MSTSTVTKAQITDFLVNMMTKEKQIDPNLLHPNNELKNIGIDSFGFLEVIFSIENQYNISLPKNYEHLLTIQDVIDVTYDLIKENNSSLKTA